MRRLLLFAVCWLLLAAAGCAEAPAPEKITDFSKWLWRNYESADNDALANAIVQLNGTVTEVTADKPLKALITRLDQSDVTLVGLKGEAKLAVGLLAVTESACTLAQVEKIHTSGDPGAVHPDAYKAYKRTFVQSRDDYLAHKLVRLDWDTELTSNYATEKLKGGVRFVADAGKVKSPFGAALVSRTFLKEPAVGSDSSTTWPQDYQIEAYYERSPGKVVHLFAVWRQADFSGLSTESSFLQNIQMGGFVDWDKEMEKACKSGKF